MSLEGIVLGLLAIVVGLAWAFYGLKLFAILLPIWAFFFGLVTGASWGAQLFGAEAGLFATTLSWIIGIVRLVFAHSSRCTDSHDTRGRAGCRVGFAYM